MAAIIALCSFLTIFLLSYIAILFFYAADNQVEMRLRSLDTAVLGRSDIDEELARPIRERLLAPFRRSLADWIGKMTPQSLQRMVETKMAMAGGIGNLSVNEFLLMWGIWAGGLIVLAFCIVAVISLPLKNTVMIMLAAVLAGGLLPLMLLKRKIAQRQTSIQKDLPEVLDLLTVSVEAGLAFDGALSKLAEKMKGALVDELARALQEMRIGLPKRTALQNLAQRCDVADVSLFTTSLIQADQLGVSISKVLRIQSAGMREKRRQRVQEKAMKAPVKMLIPLVMFVFPTIFIVLLGPAVIRIMTTLMNK